MSLCILNDSISCTCTSARRHRLSEADEDEELMEYEDDDLEGPSIVRFSDNPYCELSLPLHVGQIRMVLL